MSSHIATRSSETALPIDDGARPLRDTPTSSLIDTLEAQHDHDESYDSEIVWEIVNRLVAAENISAPTRLG